MFRSFHFIPAHKNHLFSRIDSLNADEVIFDLEDAVPIDKKSIGRKNLLSFLKDNNKSNFWIRCNNIESSDFFLDLELIKQVENIGIVVPKVENSDFLNHFKFVNDLKIIILIESFEGYQNIKQIVTSKSIFGIGLGLEDMFSVMTIENTRLKKLTEFLRLNIICFAKANNLVCIDGISNNFSDKEKLINECSEIRNLGFDAKFSIHPFQIEIINESFGIDESQKKWAEKIEKATNLESGFGYVKVDDEIITPPKIIKAKMILEKG